MKKIGDFFKSLDIQSVLWAVVMLVMGVLFIVFPENALRIICYVCGAVVIVWGIVHFILCFRHGAVLVYEIIIGCVMVASGILLIVAPHFIAELVTVLLGIVLIVDSVLKIMESHALYKLNNKGWIPGAVIGVVCAVLGLVIIFNPFATTRVLMVFVGVSMIVDAVCSLGVNIFAAAREGDERNGKHGGDNQGGGNVIDI